MWPFKAGFNEVKAELAKPNGVIEIELNAADKYLRKILKDPSVSMAYIQLVLDKMNKKPKRIKHIGRIINKFSRMPKRTTNGIKPIRPTRNTNTNE